MPKKVQSSWPDVAKALEQKLKSSHLTHQEVSDASGVGYYAVRRFRLKGVQNCTESATKLCAFFEVSIKKDNKVQPDTLAHLQALVEEVWDGSEQQAQLLTRLMQAVSPQKP